MGDGHLDLPLARTVQTRALRRRLHRDEVTRWLDTSMLADTDPERAGLRPASADRPTPLAAAVSVGAWFGGVLGAVGLIALLISRERDHVLPLLVVVAAFALVPAVLTYVGVSVTRRVTAERAARRHARLAALATDNGLRHEPVALERALPDPVVRASRGGYDVQHLDVVHGQVRGRAVMVGLREATRSVSRQPARVRFQWVAVERRHRERGVPPKEVERAARALLRHGELSIERDRGWIVVGVEDTVGRLRRIPALLAVADVVLGAEADDDVTRDDVAGDDDAAEPTDR